MEDKNFSLETYDLKAVKHEIHIYQRKLAELRKEGSTKILNKEEEIGVIKDDKLLPREEKKERIIALRDEIKVAREVKKDYKEEEKAIILEAKDYLKNNLDPYYKAKKEEAVTLRKEAKAKYEQDVSACKTEFNETYENAKVPLDGETLEQTKTRLNVLRRTHSSKLYELKLNYKKRLQDIKTEVHEIYLDKVRYLNSFNDDRLLLNEKIAANIERYMYRFNIKDFLLKNGLYIVMILFFIICGLLAPVMNKGTFFDPQFKNIFEILNLASPRIFLALGVAGLILLAGTDLSIGRMVGLSSVITCMFLVPGMNSMPIFGQTFDFTSIPGEARIIIALLITILFTTLFSSIAGFFSAKFKMHPFISTMGTQLIIFGLTAVVTEQKNTGVIDMGLKNAIAGKLFNNTFPLLFIYAIICIIIVSFIWNKTKFGKNMYAVGGNPEAASVSGISVFWVTMGVFIMAGILYGFGGFFEAVRGGNGKFDIGTGYETDAIAACVVGGISFSGGVGKISGAVFGAIVFTAMSYVLTFLGIDPYYQFILRGTVIILAVTLDCLKYLKKK